MTTLDTTCVSKVMGPDVGADFDPVVELLNLGIVDDEVFTFAEQHDVIGLGNSGNGGQGPFHLSYLRRSSCDFASLRHESICRFSFVVDRVP